MAPKEYEKYIKTYFKKEQKAYEDILENHETVISGTVKELSQRFNMTVEEVAGFIDGINTSLVKEIDLDSLEEDSMINLEVDFKKLYYNMLEAKASWLYNLPQWDGVLNKETREQIKAEYKKSKIAISNKVGRNDPCPCGSGKKYKKCCGAQV
ncbi:MAG TPA: SEC-C domain-containing protein [Clostridiaceae bacterium]|nr:SEC-C domain-containing protein [Clostridiaceae bacterium]